MIGSLRGTIIERDAMLDKGSAEVLVEVMGVGYRVTVTSATLSRLVPNDETMLHIHHHLWEADQKLFGFSTRDERNAFEGLLGAHKVGPALALAIIGTYPPAELAQVLATDDIDSLCEVPGVGKKTAQRLLVDLKSSLVLPVVGSEDGVPIDLTSAGTAGAALADVREALANLGYGTDEIKKAVAGLETDALTDPAADSGALLKQALRVLAGG
jgi:Holliday junction DNA helicase RuvA